MKNVKNKYYPLMGVIARKSGEEWGLLTVVRQKDREVQLEIVRKMRDGWTRFFPHEEVRAVEFIEGSPLWSLKAIETMQVIT